MYVASVNSNPNSFKKTIENLAKSSVDIEQASIENKYINTDVAHYVSSEMNLNIYDNVLLNKYFSKIKATCTTKNLSREEQFKYNYRPELLSSDNYGSPSLWYLILKCNNCEDFNDFKDLPTVQLPDLVTIENCLTNEEYIKAKSSL